MSSSRSFTCSQLWTTKLHHARKNWTDQFSCWCRATRWTLLHDWLNKQQKQKQKQKETKTKIQSGNQKWTKANKHKSKINNKWKNILAIHVDNVCNIPIREVTRCRQIEQPTKTWWGRTTYFPLVSGSIDKIDTFEENELLLRNV